MMGITFKNGFVDRIDREYLPHFKIECPSHVYFSSHSDRRVVIEAICCLKQLCAIPVALPYVLSSKLYQQSSQPRIEFNSCCNRQQ